MSRADVVVVGAGVAGAATAWWLARRGRDVVLVERFESAHTRGSSHGGSRIFRFAYGDPAYAAMAVEALPLWQELEDDAGTRLLETTGGVDHGDEASVREVASSLGAVGARHEVLRPEAAAERWPGIRFEGLVVHSPDGGRCLADATVAALQDRAAAHGADVRFVAGPARVMPATDRVAVHTETESWDAAVAVLTCGPWTGATAASLGIDLPPLRVTCEQVQHFPLLDPAAGPAWPSFIHHREPWIYGLWTPGEGVKVARHMAGRTVDPDDGPFAPDSRVSDEVAEHVREWFPGLDPVPTNAATCLYTTTPSHEFVLARHGPIVIGSACSGHGFKFAPLVGRRLADLADDALTGR